MNNNNDEIKSPKHYQLDGLEIESIDVIKAILGNEGFKAFCHGNALKYLTRALKKDNELKDFQKAQQYIKWYIKTMKGGE